MQSKSLSLQLKSLSLILVCTLVPAILLLAMVVALSSVADVPLENFMRDTNQVAEVPFYTGFISQVGILFWCAAAAVCFLAFAVLWQRGTQSSTALFFMGGGLLSGLLMLDDAFLIHEKIAPFYLNMSNNVVFLIYGLCGLAFLILCRKTILNSDFLLLFLSIILLASSLVLDKLHDYELFSYIGLYSESAIYFLEDSFKLLGISVWLSYFARAGFIYIKNRFTSAGNALV